MESSNSRKTMTTGSNKGRNRANKKKKSQQMKETTNLDPNEMNLKGQSLDEQEIHVNSNHPEETTSTSTCTRPLNGMDRLSSINDQENKETMGSKSLSSIENETESLSSFQNSNFNTLRNPTNNEKEVFSPTKCEKEEVLSPTKYKEEVLIKSQQVSPNQPSGSQPSRDLGRIGDPPKLNSNLKLPLSYVNPSIKEDKESRSISPVHISPRTLGSPSLKDYRNSLSSPKNAEYSPKKELANLYESMAMPENMPHPKIPLQVDGSHLKKVPSQEYGIMQSIYSWFRCIVNYYRQTTTEGEYEVLLQRKTKLVLKHDFYGSNAIVTEIPEDYEAEDEYIHVNDVLVDVNNVSLERKNMEEIYEILNQQSYPQKLRLRREAVHYSPARIQLQYP